MGLGAVRFVVIDQSLRDMNGHYYEYDISIAEAARDMGVAPQVVANRGCDPALASDAMPIRSYFTWAWDEGHQDRTTRLARYVLGGMPAEVRPFVIALGSRAHRWLQGPAGKTNGARRLPSFGHELSALIRAERLTHGDHVLVHTLSVAELHSMIDALRHRRDLPALHILLRRDAGEPAVQFDHWGGIQAAFVHVRGDSELLSCMRFYSDTVQLCRQYEALSGGLPVTLLPIPHGLLLPSVPGESRPSGPACVTYLGNARTEKGFHFLPAAIDSLRVSHIETGRLRFVIQANANLSLEEAVIAGARRKLAAYGKTKVELLIKPLTIAEFQARLLQADLILLPYLPECYRNRSSGILVQALVCGRPVVVPSGTWLSDCAPPEVAVMFDGPKDLPKAIAEAVERLPELLTAAAKFAPQWYQTHNAKALVSRLLASA